MQDTLHAVADLLKSLLQGGEEYTCGFSGEESDFVRFNKNRVRQAGTVTNRSVSIDLIRGRRQISKNCLDIWSAYSTL